MSSDGSPQIGPCIQAFRKRQALTLDDLARMSSVSRSMLSQIERGQANPTLATVWSLANALKVDVAELIGVTAREARDQIEVASEAFTPEIRTDDGLCTLRILSPANHAETLEWYELRFEPGGSLVSQPHAKGTREHLTVLEGTFEVEAGTQKVAVPQGSTARYAADVPHRITNKAKRRARALLVVAS